ncbi:hypothetical protein ACP93_09800 [Xanthomonas sp. NCPPB 1128]|uniref:DUF6630 family protein n=1 Tax=Xanthomonas sp. NCPPB 1128 TaxID=1775876 RepID=UPI00065AFF70|nr:DUF6630 family protein [Xanthomonas sp. NCPPB 1128]KMM75748.1 hypothetical protein ACP93_09800 [Xanthomonas sp. NCPPB 1128]
MHTARDTWMSICDTLAPEDHGLRDDVALAIEAPSRYLQQFEDPLFERGIEEPHQVSPWLALVDGLISRGLCTEVDWKVDAADLAHALGELRPLAGMRDVLSPLAASQTRNEEALTLAARCLQVQSMALLHLDIDSDSYPLLVVPADRRDAVLRMAEALGEHAAAL